MFKPYNFRIDHGRICGGSANRIISNGRPSISWAVQGSTDGVYQSQYKIEVESSGRTLWSTDWILSSEQSALYGGEELPVGPRINVTVTIKDDKGNESLPGTDYFFFGQMQWNAEWIACSEDEARKAAYFNKCFNLEYKPEDAYLLVCGIGYQHVEINGKCVDSSLMSPAYSDYSDTCYYIMMPELAENLHVGENRIQCIVGDGWRRINSDFLDAVRGGVKTTFDGIPQLSAMLFVKCGGKWSMCCSTDSSWVCSHGPIVSHNIYDGSTYDARISVSDFKPVRVVPAPGGKMIVQSLEPIVRKETRRSLSVILLKPDTYIVDFGQNTAGFAALKLPCHTVCGQEIVISYAELLKEDGDLFMEPLREAKCTDKYICAGGDCNEAERIIWEPDFTYHGFRYARVTGYGDILTADDITSVSIYTDIDKKDTFFTCGSALVNQIHKNTIMCEKSNLHSILTDCPQRNERMAWMNDATVRFEETPYNFDIGRLFPKVVRDLLCVQDEDGAITCTAPFIVGGRPADPVCSSFLVAGLCALMHTDNTDIIKEAYDGFAKWENCLLARSDNYIVNYSYYGDWASPADCCIGDDGANSALTPGILMSTGYSYYNCKVLEKFAQILGKEDDAIYYADTADKIRRAFLDKWFDPSTGKVASASQACQVFPLWLGIIPQEHVEKAVRVLCEDIVSRNYRITTGNLCTRYLFDVLAENGHIDDAWELITSETYPSIGYMIQNEATTIWERFELKKNPGMNSHNHPMYGAVDYCLYAHICGLKPTSPGWKTFSIKPYLPSKLLSAHCQVETPMGPITVRWLKQYGQKQLHICIPFGACATVDFGGNTQELTAGTYNILI